MRSSAMIFDYSLDPDTDPKSAIIQLMRHGFEVHVIKNFLEVRQKAGELEYRKIHYDIGSTLAESKVRYVERGMLYVDDTVTLWRRHWWYP